jgi:hypothetical protein
VDGPVDSRPPKQGLNSLQKRSENNTSGAEESA